MLQQRRMHVNPRISIWVMEKTHRLCLKFQYNCLCVNTKEVSVLPTRTAVFVCFFFCFCGCKLTTDLSVKMFCIFNVGISEDNPSHLQLFRQFPVHMMRFLSTFHCRLVWNHQFGLKSGRSIYTVSCVRKKASPAFPSLYFLLFLRWREMLLFVDATEQLLGISKACPHIPLQIYNRI